jgi:lipopolysaccharide/colanic/teichoic acid biosynthesis glycosyltransferase
MESDFSDIAVTSPRSQLDERFRSKFAALARAGKRRPSVAYRRAGKRAFDVAFAAVLLLCLAIPFVLIAVAIKLDSRGPVFYRVRRVGHRGRPLMMLKFRKMRDDAAGLPLTAHRDPRLTRVGRVLTQTRLDELPQFWDVLRGRMSLIGPRPEDPTFVALHRADYEQILTVRPGVSGLAQIAYKEETTIVDAGRPVDDYVDRIMPEKLTLDKLYAGSCSVKLDVWVLGWTLVTMMLDRPVSVHRGTGKMSVRRRVEPTVEPAMKRIDAALAGPAPSRRPRPPADAIDARGRLRAKAD